MDPAPGVLVLPVVAGQRKSRETRAAGSVRPSPLVHPSTCSETLRPKTEDHSDYWSHTRTSVVVVVVFVGRFFVFDVRRQWQG